jgi:hypothetical protein
MYGEEKNRIKTEDKISAHTKNHIEKRETLRKTGKGSKREKIELCELQNLIKKQIRRDIYEFEENKVKEVICRGHRFDEKDVEGTEHRT